jgi:hypothetical protein
VKWLLVLALLIFSKVAYADHNKTITEWSLKDIILVPYMCRTENTILQIADIDKKGPAKEVVKQVNKSLYLFGCVLFSKALPFEVEEIIYEYLNHENRDSVVLRIYSSDLKISGYALSFGKASKTGI